MLNLCRYRFGLPVDTSCFEKSVSDRKHAVYGLLNYRSI